MSEVVVRVEVPFMQVSKTLKLATNELVSASVISVLKKVNGSTDLPCVFFLPDQTQVSKAAGTIAPSGGVWLDNNKPLSAYNIKQQETLYLKRQPSELVILQAENETRRVFKIDLHATVGEVIRDLCAELEFKKPEDYFLDLTDVLSKDLSLYAQGVRAGGTCTLRSKKLNVATIARNVGAFVQKNMAPAVETFKNNASELLNKTIAAGSETAEMLAAATRKGSLIPGSSDNLSKSSNRIFGVSMEQAMKVGNNPFEIPLIIERAIQYIEANHMETEGIFRLSGGALTVNTLKERLDRGEDVDFNSITDPHAVTGVFKMYLRELPEPILTFERFQLLTGIALPRAFEGDSRHRYYRAVLKTLPRVNYLVAKRLLSFLQRVAEHKAVNKMGTVNLATVFGPNLLRVENESAMQAVENNSLVAQVIDDLINLYKKIFEHTGKDVKYTHFVRAKFAFTATNAQTELSFPEGAIICVTNSESKDGWWEGELMGSLGLFPTNHVEVLMDLTKIELNDDVSIASAKLKEDIVSIQRQIKDDIKLRKDTEDQVIALVSRFQALEGRLASAEETFGQLSVRKAEIQQAVAAGVPPPKPAKVKMNTEAAASNRSAPTMRPKVSSNASSSSLLSSLSPSSSSSNITLLSQQSSQSSTPSQQQQQQQQQPQPPPKMSRSGSSPALSVNSQKAIVMPSFAPLDAPTSPTLTNLPESSSSATLKSLPTPSFSDKPLPTPNISDKPLPTPNISSDKPLPAPINNASSSLSSKPLPTPVPKPVPVDNNKTDVKAGNAKTAPQALSAPSAAEQSMRLSAALDDMFADLEMQLDNM